MAGLEPWVTEARCGVQSAGPGTDPEVGALYAYATACG